MGGLLEEDFFIVITSCKQLTSGNNLTIRTDAEGKGDCSVVRCEFTKKASKSDKEEAAILATKVLADVEYKGDSKIEWAD
jgi:hypothetical protein